MDLAVRTGGVSTSRHSLQAMYGHWHTQEQRQQSTLKRVVVVGSDSAIHMCHTGMHISSDASLMTVIKSKEGDVIGRTSKYWLALRLALPSLEYHSPVEICRQQVSHKDKQTPVQSWWASGHVGPCSCSAVYAFTDTSTKLQQALTASQLSSICLEILQART